MSRDDPKMALIDFLNYLTYWDGTGEFTLTLPGWTQAEAKLLWIALQRFHTNPLPNLTGLRQL